MAEAEGGERRPTTYRYIRDTDGSVQREAYKEGQGLTFATNPEEGRLRFIAVIQHAGLVRLLQGTGERFQFDVSREVIDDLLHYQIGVRAKDNSAELFLIRKPESDTGDLT